MTTPTHHQPAHVHHRDRIGAHRAREARIITTVLAVLCGAGLGAAVIPGVETAVNAGLLALAALLALGLAVRYLARWLQERHEDQQDAVTAARWRAAHAPHLLHDRTLTGAATGRGIA